MVVPLLLLQVQDYFNMLIELVSPRVHTDRYTKVAHTYNLFI